MALRKARIIDYALSPPLSLPIHYRSISCSGAPQTIIRWLSTLTMNFAFSGRIFHSVKKLVWPHKYSKKCNFLSTAVVSFSKTLIMTDLMYIIRKSSTSLSRAAIMTLWWAVSKRQVDHRNQHLSKQKESSNSSAIKTFWDKHSVLLQVALILITRFRGLFKLKTRPSLSSSST